MFFKKYIYLVVILLSSLIFALPKHLDGDLFLWANMSIIKPTVFIWEQNRYLNIIPILTSVIKSPLINLIAQMVINATLFAIGLILVLRMFLKITELEWKKEYEAITIALVLISMKPDYFVFFHSWYGGPYCFSFGITLYFILKENNDKISKIALPLLMFVFVGVNPSLIIPIALLFPIIIVKSNERMICLKKYFLVFSSVLFWIWLGAKISVGPKYSINLNQLYIDLVFAINSFFAQFITVNLYLLIFSTIILFLVNRERKILLNIVYFLFISVVAFLLVTSNTHVKNNGYASRYYFYSYIFWLLPVVYVSIIKLKAKKWILLAPILIMYLFYFISNFSLQAYKERLIELNNLQQKIIISESKLITGNYWDVMPAVYMGLVAGESVLPVTYRSLDISEKIEKQLLADKKLLCISSVEDCIQSSRYAGNFIIPSNCNNNCIVGMKELTELDYTYSVKERCNEKCVLIQNKTINEYSTFPNFVNDSIYKISGISEPESYGVWSDGSFDKCVSIYVNEKSKNYEKLTLTARGYRDASLVIENKNTKKILKLSDNLSTYNFDLSGYNFSKGVLKLCPTKLERPIDHKENSDKRLLGVFINRMELN